MADTPEGRRAMAAVESEGGAGEAAFEKAIGREREPVAKAELSAAERQLDDLATGIAKARGITREQPMRQAIATPEGRQLHRAYREEVASR